MRYECPQCGDTTPFGTSCASCDVPMIDEHGHTPPPLEEVVMQSDPHVADAMVTYPIGHGRELIAHEPAWIGFMDLFNCFARLYHWLRRRARDLLLPWLRRKEMEQLPSVTPIALATEGVVRIRGRVQLLQPVTAPDAVGPCAAYVWRTRTTHACGCSQWCTARGWTMTTKRECGRFVVFDESGAALVDDDFFEMFMRDGASLPGDDSRGIVLYDGDEVEIIGPAKRAHAQARGVVLQGTFRDNRALLVFDGDPTALVKLVV